MVKRAKSKPPHNRINSEPPNPIEELRIVRTTQIRISFQSGFCELADELLSKDFSPTFILLLCPFAVPAVLGIPIAYENGVSFQTL